MEGWLDISVMKGWLDISDMKGWFNTSVMKGWFNISDMKGWFNTSAMTWPLVSVLKDFFKDYCLKGSLTSMVCIRA